MHTVPNVLPRSLCSWPLTSLHLLEEGHNHPIVRFVYLCHMIGEELVFFSVLYIKLFELGVEVALNHQSVVTHHKVNLLKFPLRSSSLNMSRQIAAFVHKCVSPEGCVRAQGRWPEPTMTNWGNASKT